MKDLIIKHNQVVKASYRLTPNEQVVILTALSKIEKNVTDSVLYELNVKDLAKTTGISEKKSYQTFKSVCFALQDRKITIKNGSNKRISWIQTVEYIEGEGVVRIRFGYDILPYLTKLKDNFTTYHLKHVAKFKSTYGIRIYELVKLWQNTKNSVEISIQEMKEFFQLEDKYERTDALKNRVIKPALLDINTYSDLYVECENIKFKRKITGFKFLWKKKCENISTLSFVERNARAGESWSEAIRRLNKKVDKL